MQQADVGITIVRIPEQPAGGAGVGRGFDLSGDLGGAVDEFAEGVVAESLEPRTVLFGVDVGAFV